MPDATAVLYRGELGRLDAALVAYRHVEHGAARGGRASSNNGAAARCGCGRRIRVAESVLSAGPITCGLCGSDFEAAEPGQPVTGRGGHLQRELSADPGTLPVTALGGTVMTDQTGTGYEALLAAQDGSQSAEEAAREEGRRAVDAVIVGWPGPRGRRSTSAACSGQTRPSPSSTPIRRRASGSL